jgi:AraC-like DNA-binding protein
MEKKILLVVGLDLALSQEVQNVLENEGYEVKFISILTGDIINHIVKITPQLVMIDIEEAQSDRCIQLGRYLLNEDLIPFLYLSSNANNVILENIKRTRPYGFLIKPLRDKDVKACVKLILYNYTHKNIDLLKTDKKVIEDVPYRIRHVINYINENINEKIDIDELANLTRWKKHHFIRIFSSIIGVTPYQYILINKMEIAKALIENTDQPINEIAFDLGFVNYSNFGHIFKKICYTSPENYRKTKKQYAELQKSGI